MLDQILGVLQGVVDNFQNQRLTLRGVIPAQLPFAAGHQLDVPQERDDHAGAAWR